MASSSEDLRDNRRVKFTGKVHLIICSFKSFKLFKSFVYFFKEKENQVSSSGGSNSDDENEDYDADTSHGRSNVVSRNSSGSNQIYLNNKSKKVVRKEEVIFFCQSL